MKMKKVEFLVEEAGSCKKVFIPREYCTIFLQGAAKDYIETGIIGDDFEIQNLADDMKCQKESITLKNQDGKIQTTTSKN